jgi:hypothetical protein
MAQPWDGVDAIAGSEGVRAESLHTVLSIPNEKCFKAVRNGIVEV